MKIRSAAVREGLGHLENIFFKIFITYYQRCS